MDKPFAAHKPTSRTLRTNFDALAQDLFERRRDAMGRSGVKLLAVADHQSAERSFAQTARLFDDRVEHRRKVARRGVDDLQYLRGTRLLLQRLARLGQEARIL